MLYGLAKKVDEPTTRIIGEQGRWDQREQQHTKAAVGELGERVRERWTSESVDPFRRIFFPETRPMNVPMRSWLPIADGPVNPEAVEVKSPAKMSEIIKAAARFFGAALVGVCKLEPALIYTHRGLRIDHAKSRAGEPITLNHKYAVSIGIPMDFDRLHTSPSFIDGAEVGRLYLETAKVAVCLACYILELGYPAKAHFHMSEDVLHIPIAVKAGLGELARNNSLITQEFGPRLRLSTVTTDLPLAVDQPVSIGVQEYCNICNKCAVNCPAQCIPYGEKTVIRGVERWGMDNDACMTYWTANRSKWNDCARCISVCPWNMRPGWYHKVTIRMATMGDWARRLLLWIDNRLYGEKPKPKVEWLYYSTKRRDERLRVVDKDLKLVE